MFGQKNLILIFVGLTVANAAAWWVMPFDFDPQRSALPAIKFDREKFEPIDVIRAFEPIVDPPHVPLAEANEALKPNELVLGVTVEGQSRAYPINMLNGPRREILNDELGGKRIAATW